MLRSQLCNRHPVSIAVESVEGALLGKRAEERYTKSYLLAPTVRFRSRLCKNAGSVLKSALLLKICRRLICQQTLSLRRRAFFVPIQTIKPTRKCFYTVSVKSGRC